MVGMWRSQHTHMLLVEMSHGASALEASLAISEKVKHRFTLRPSSSTPKCILKWEQMLMQNLVHGCSR